MSVESATRVPRPWPPRSPAAGWAAPVRVGWFPVIVAIAAVVELVPWIEPTGDGDTFHIHRPGRGALPAALIAWTVWTLFAPAWRRHVAERRRRRGDVVWPVARTSRRISAGLPGLTTPFALSVAFAGILCAWCWRYLDTHANIWHDRYLFDWTDADAEFVVAGYALPLIWLLLVIVPRFGRGKLVVAWPGWPPRTGGRNAFEISVSPRGAQIEGPRVFLRRLRLRHPLLPFAARRARLEWANEARLPFGARVGPTTRVTAAFDVPASAPETGFHEDGEVRWEILVMGRVGAADYADAVVVPVYAPR